MMSSRPKQPTNPSRRRWLGGAALALAGLGLACSRQGAAANAIAAAGPPTMVDIVAVDNGG